jgi:hypothetical protein
MTLLIYLLGGHQWINGSTYIRFSHIVLPGLWAYLLEWVTTLLCLILFLTQPVAPRPGALLCRLRRFSANRLRACVIVFGCAICGRLVLLTIEPFPGLMVDDESSYLLQGDTLAHGRLANPVLPVWRHFEPAHVLMEPTYSSMYPPAFAAFLAAGETIFKTPRAGLLISVGLAAAALCWMLQPWLPAEWAFVGGLIAVVRIGWFSYFGNAYWGGSAGMIGGCLLLGAAGRLYRSARPRTGDAIVLALSLCLLANSRPYEGFVTAVPVCLWMLVRARRGLTRRAVIPALAVLAIGSLGTAYYCYRVTGRLILPQALQRSQWAIAPSILLQKPNYNHTYEFADQDGLYKQYEMAETYTREASLGGYVAGLPEKFFREWLFFISPPLTVAAFAGLFPTVRSRKYRLVVCGFAFLCLALALETWVQPQYVAVGAGVLYLFMLNGMRWLRAGARRRGSKWRQAGPRLVAGTFGAVVLAVAARLFIVPIEQWPPSWSSWNHTMPAYRAINKWLLTKPGKQLVIVHYRPGHFWGDSWVHNGADPATQKVIWARDTEPAESNDAVVCAFSNREVLIFQPPDAGYQELPDSTFRQSWDMSVFFTPYQQHHTCEPDSK